jgi:alpha-glucosidase
MEGFRCFTWNKEYFPDPKRMVAELRMVLKPL